MNKKELIEKINIERECKVHKIHKYEYLDKYDLYIVDVTGESYFFETKILNTTYKIPYPFSKYNNLPDKVRNEIYNKYFNYT